jgi:hypothetical protein
MSTGGIDRHERAQLDILANSLHITENEKLEVEQEVKNNHVNKANSDFSELDDLYELDFMDAKKDILVKNDLSSALLKLKQIYDQVQTNDEVSCLYFLIKALKNPTAYIANYEAKSFEDYWENYWYFLAQLANGDNQRKGAKSFSQNHSKYPNKRDEIVLSEAIYRIVAYQNSNNESYIEKANDKLVEIESISASFLLKLYKSTKQIILNYDPVDQKFTNLTPPDEPGMREYFLFFVNHLFKIAPEVPKVEAPAAKTVAAPVAPKLPTRPSEVLQSPPPVPTPSPKPMAGPKLPSLPPQPAAKQAPGPSQPKLPTLPPGVKPANTGPKLPQIPTLPPTPPNNKVNLPKTPPVPGKK